MESKRMIQQINRAKSWFFDKLNKINRLLTKLIKRRKEKTLINKFRDEKGILEQTPVKFRGSCGNILRGYIPANWRIKK
jgi:hypothetical protein